MTTETPQSEPNHVILFDGECVLCSAWCRFVLRRDVAARFRWASVQSEAGQRLLSRHGLPLDVFDTMVYLQNGQAHIMSDAFLRVCRELPAPVRWLWALRFCPRVLRDAVYRLVASNRYRWFGRHRHCAVPSPQQRERFL